MVVGGYFLFVERPSRYPDFQDPPQVPSDVPPSLATPDNLLTLDIARWYDLYP